MTICRRWITTTLRRGKPTCHRAFDEATAILAGDGLLTYAFEILNTAPVSDAKKVELTLLLSRAAGAFNGMISGQVLDLYTDSHQDFANPEAIIRHTEELKTAACCGIRAKPAPFLAERLPPNAKRWYAFPQSGNRIPDNRRHT